LPSLSKVVMLYFIFGEDSYRAKRKLEEMISGYKKVHQSGLNLIYIDAGEKDFKDFHSNLKTNSMFAEKKLIILKSLFDNAKFQEDFMENMKGLEELKDIIVIYEDRAPDQRTKLFKALQKTAKCQEFSSLEPAMLKRWVAAEFEKNKVTINPDALDLLASFVGGDLWAMANEINKLSSYRSGSTVNRQDVELLVKPNTENEIFKTIEAVASKDKKYALSLLHKHLEDGDNALYLLSMIAYQFRNLLTIKELQDMQTPYGMIAKKSGLHPFVVQKTYNLCSQFSMPNLKKIYQNIFQVDSDIKTGKIEAETALDILLSEI
jgi:DNA polymerase III subunit delta